MKNTLTDYETSLLHSWEEIYKKGQVTLWVLLAVRDEPKHMAQIKDFIVTHAGKAITVDDQTMYRALRRYYDADMVTFTQAPTKGAPDRKLYQLTDTGRQLLRAFVERNITNVYQKADVQRLMHEESK